MSKTTVCKVKVARPNKLYFGTVVDDCGTTKHDWTLKSSNGKVIASSHALYSKKILAVRNAILIFGEGLWVERHVVSDPYDYKMVLEEGVKQEKANKL